MITDFIFDGQRLSDFGYIICDFNSSTGIETFTVSGISFTDIKSPLSNISHNVATSYDENLSRTIQIMKSPCDNENIDITNDDISEMTRWLCRKEYKMFKWIDNKDDDEIFYEAQIKLQKVTLAGGNVGFELNITSNRPYGFTKDIKINYSKPFPLTTYECVENKYEKGTKNDVLLSLFYPVHNREFKKYEEIFRQLPEDLTENYDYYFFGRRNCGSNYGNCIAFGVKIVSTDAPYYFSIGGSSAVSSAGGHNYQSFWDNIYEDYQMSVDGQVAGFSTTLWGDDLLYYWKQYEYTEGQGWTMTINHEADGEPHVLDKSHMFTIKNLACLGTNINFYSEWDIIFSSGYTYQMMSYNRLVRAFPLSYINDNLPTTSKDLVVNVFSDDEGYIYPDIVIKIKKDGDLNILNKYENRNTCIKDCKRDEIITITGCDTLQITSSDTSHDISKCFNYKFPRLCSLYRNYTNAFSVDLDCDIEVKYKGIRKVGI